MQCYRGWILSKNDAGFDVPFFVKVRSNDVFYSTSISEKFYQSGVLDESNVDSSLILPAGQTYILNMDTWRVILNNNELVTMNRSVPFIPEYVKLVDGHIDMELKLPIKIGFNDYTITTVTKKCKNKNLILSQQNVTYGEPSEKFEVDTVTISTYKHDGSAFTAAEMDTDDFQNSWLEVTIQAIAQLGEYAHVDDAEQLGATWNGVTGSNGAVANTYTRAEINSLLDNLRDEISRGEVLSPTNIISLVDTQDQSDALNKGFMLDIVSEDEGKVDVSSSSSTSKQNVDSQLSVPMDEEESDESTIAPSAASLDVEEEEETVEEAQVQSEETTEEKVTETQELNEKASSDEVIDLDFNDLFGSSTKLEE